MSSLDLSWFAQDPRDFIVPYKSTMGSEAFNRDLEMVNAGCFSPEVPLTTKFPLMEDYQNNPCPRFYGKVEDKEKVYQALKETIHPEVCDK